MEMLRRRPMQPVAFRSRHAEPVPVGERMIQEWHITQWELLDGSGELAGYRGYCGTQIQIMDAIVEPGRIGAFHDECARHGHLPKWG